MKNHPWGVPGGSLGVPEGSLGAKMAQRLVPWPNLGPTWSYLGANLGPTWANLGLILSNLGPTWGQMVQKWSPNGPQTGPKLNRNLIGNYITFLCDFLINLCDMFDVFFDQKSMFFLVGLITI